MRSYVLYMSSREFIKEHYLPQGTKNPVERGFIQRHEKYFPGYSYSALISAPEELAIDSIHNHNFIIN
jgi:hypothetical protein